MIIDRGELTKQRLGDLTVGGNDNLTRLSIDDIKRDFFSKENVRQLFSQLLCKLIFLLLVFIVNLLNLLFELCRIELVLALAGKSVCDNADILNDTRATGGNPE